MCVCVLHTLKPSCVTGMQVIKVQQLSNAYLTVADWGISCHQVNCGLLLCNLNHLSGFECFQNGHMSAVSGCVSVISNTANLY